MKKDRVLLVFPRTRPHDLDPQVPNALLALAPGIREHGFEPVIVDTRIQPDWREALAREAPRAVYVGISSMSGPQLRFALEAAGVAREAAPDCSIVWGGMHATLFPEQTARHPLVDIVVRGNADDTAGELAACLDQGGDLHKLPGISFQLPDSSVVSTPDRPLYDMSKVREPAWDLIDPTRYTVVGVETARGCPHRCGFCYNQGVNKRRWRHKPEDMVLREIATLKQRWGVDSISMVDDNFFSDPARAGRIARRLIDEDIGVRWSSTCRAPYLAHWDDAYIELLKRSGVFVLFSGIESGSPRVLDYIQKDCTVSDIELAALKAKRHSLRLTTTFILGFPGETYDEWLETLDMVDRLSDLYPDIVLENIFAYTPYPGNALYDDAIAMGFEPPANLEAWAGGWVEAQLPWLDARQRAVLEHLAYIYRFVFWGEELHERFVGPRRWREPLYRLLRADARLRWRRRAFGAAPEFAALKRLAERVSREGGDHGPKGTERPPPR